MTTQELINARKAYHEYKEGKQELLELLDTSAYEQALSTPAYHMCQEGRNIIEDLQKKANFSKFITTYMNVNKDRVAAISDDEILRNAFLSNFQDTKESSNIIVLINYIQRINDRIDDGQPILTSVDWTKDNIQIPENLREYNLYCDLETNKPILIKLNELTKLNTILDFNDSHTTIYLPGYKPITENYSYCSTSLEKITKGAATEQYNRLQLYYFRQLLDNSREEAATRIKTLTKDELSKICNSK